MDIVAALFIEGIDVRQERPGGPARIDLSGVHFSTAAPGEPPFTIAPHLVVILRCPPGQPGEGALEVVFLREGAQVARNVQPVQVEPGKFGYRLVRAELAFESPGTVEAHCRLAGGPATVVPLTVLPSEGPTA